MLSDVVLWHFPLHKSEVVIDVDVKKFLQQKKLEVETVRFVDFLSHTSM